jgi:hypothetical protein
LRREQAESSRFAEAIVNGVTGRVVPIRQYLGADGWFGPEDVNGIGEAFSAALNKLGLNDRSDPMVEMVARRIIRAAMAGERNPTKLIEIGVGGEEK